MLEQAPSAGLRAVTVLLHSFTFLEKKDVQYESAWPVPALIRRFEGLCRFLADHGDRYEVRTLAGLGREELPGAPGPGKPALPAVPAALSLLRTVEQAKLRVEKWLH